MWCCLVELFLFVFAIVTLVKGKYTLSTSKAVFGTPAHAIGTLFLLPLLIGQGGGALYGFASSDNKGGKGFKVDLERAMREPEMMPLAINVVGTVVPLLLAVIVAVVSAEPAVRERRYDDYEDEEKHHHSPRRDEE
jgi:hypothetical protein